MPRKSTQTMTVETETEQSRSEVIKLAVTNNELKHLSESMNRLEAKFDKAILGVAGIVILTSGAHATDLTGCRVN